MVNNNTFLMIYVNPLEISVEGMFFAFEVVKKCEKMESLDIYVGRSCRLILCSCLIRILLSVSLPWLY